MSDEITKRAKKLMQGLLITQEITDGKQREDAWLRCRRQAESDIKKEPEEVSS